MSQPPPDTLTECLACGAGAMRHECLACGGTGAMTRSQAYHWRLHEQRRRAASSTFPLVEKLIRATLEKIAVSEREGASKLVQEGIELLDHWRSTESLSQEREHAAHDLHDFHRRVLDFLKGSHE